MLTLENILASLVCVGFNFALTFGIRASQIVHLVLVSLEFQNLSINVEEVSEANISLLRKPLINFCDE